MQCIPLLHVSLGFIEFLNMKHVHCHLHNCTKWHTPPIHFVTADMKWMFHWLYCAPSKNTWTPWKWNPPLLFNRNALILSSDCISMSTLNFFNLLNYFSLVFNMYNHTFFKIHQWRLKNTLYSPRMWFLWDHICWSALFPTTRSYVFPLPSEMMSYVAHFKCMPHKSKRSGTRNFTEVHATHHNLDYTNNISI